MCLKSVKFDMNYDEQVDDFVGVGYKVIGTAHKGPWKEALGNSDGGKRNLANKISSGDFGDGRKYFPGFHIFLRQSDAEKYSRQPLYLVHFRGVTSFGNNETGDGKSGPCVIARYMKIVKELTREDG